MRRVVFLSGVIPTPATVGYERLRNLIVHKVNGKEIKDMKSLIDAFDGNMNELHSIEFDRRKPHRLPRRLRHHRRRFPTPPARHLEALARRVTPRQRVG